MSNKYDSNYYDEDGCLAGHIQERIWDEGSEAASSYGFLGRHACPYAEGSKEYEAWCNGFNQTYFQDNH